MQAFQNDMWLLDTAANAPPPFTCVGRCINNIILPHTDLGVLAPWGTILAIIRHAFASSCSKPHRWGIDKHTGIWVFSERWRVVLDALGNNTHRYSESDIAKTNTHWVAWG